MELLISGAIQPSKWMNMLLFWAKIGQAVQKIQHPLSPTLRQHVIMWYLRYCNKGILVCSAPVSFIFSWERGSTGGLEALDDQILIEVHLNLHHRNPIFRSKCVWLSVDFRHIAIQVIAWILRTQMICLLNPWLMAMKSQFTRARSQSTSMLINLADQQPQGMSQVCLLLKASGFRHLPQTLLRPTRPHLSWAETPEQFQRTLKHGEDSWTLWKEWKTS